jgi:hypothetical protein
MKTVVMPGASLMQIDVTADGGVRMTCPGCQESRVYYDAGDRVFPHRDGCPVYARIQRAMRAARRWVQ